MFLSSNGTFQLSRLYGQYLKHNRIIIAYDIDDTVRPFYCKNCDDTIKLIKEAKEVLNAYFVVYTSNPDIDGVKKFLKEKELPYDTINENLPFIPYSTGKLFYNIFLDDKAGLDQAKSVLRELIGIVKSKQTN